MCDIATSLPLFWCDISIEPFLLSVCMDDFSAISGHFSPHQAGFRRFHDTFTHILRLSEGAEQGMQDRAHTLAAFIDLMPAYDSDWWVGLESKLDNMVIRGNVYCWLASFLRGCKIRVKWNGFLDSPTYVPAGVPQGSVTAPPFHHIHQ